MNSELQVFGRQSELRIAGFVHQGELRIAVFGCQSELRIAGLWASKCIENCRFLGKVKLN